jgi:hypothetical protein
MATNGAIAAIIAANAAASAAAERAVLTAFRVGDATRPERARTPEELGIKRVHTKALVERGWVREEADGRMWLDEEAVATPRPRAKGALALVVGVLVILMVAAMIALVSQMPR